VEAEARRCSARKYAVDSAVKLSRPAAARSAVMSISANPNALWNLTHASCILPLKIPGASPARVLTPTGETNEHRTRPAITLARQLWDVEGGTGQAIPGIGRGVITLREERICKISRRVQMQNWICSAPI
jgi:hypothetical protein